MSKKDLAIAKELFERFFLESQGKPKTKIDLVFALEDLGYKYAKAEPALEYLTSRGLIELYDDRAFMTPFGVDCARKDIDIADLPQRARDWAPIAVEPAKSAPEISRSTPSVTKPELPEFRPSAPAPGSTFRPEHPQLTQIDEDGTTSVHLLGSKAVIGRAPDVDVRTLDPRASKRHAELVLDNDAYVVTDLGSANGTYLNTERITTRRLRHDDVIVVGATQFVYQCPEEFVITMVDGDPLPPAVSKPPTPTRAQPPPLKKARPLVKSKK
ncbi:MAG: FHA domain-containing protein [Deltaproteobacteria bacterium]|nr:FHA domain-containing protein [Deltaproteobacteria bacterium]